ncbi:MAG TPA: ABC-F type ribosomal protection protein [Clostridia bacterium]|nr:ABC-F type ribosomal protection protein [Clostridia bacterium]
MNLSFKGLSKGYDGKTIFENIDGQINDGDKIGLVGANGIGKTTLVRVLTGEETKDAGDITYSPSYIKTLYIQQYPEFHEGVSLYEDILKFSSKNRDDRNIYDIEGIAKMALNKVGFHEKQWAQEAISLSGGEKTKLMLARMFVGEFDFLILDEPTNHLDMESYMWLESFTENLDKPMLVISHDRFFLDKVVNRIWEMTTEGLKTYEGNYSNYRIQKEIETKTIIREHQKQETTIQELKGMINDRENWYHKAHKSAGQNDFLRSKAKKHASTLKAKRTQLERIEKEKVDKPRKELSPAFDVINKNIIGKKFPRFLIQGKNVTKKFGRKTIFKNLSFNIERGDKIALIGANGCGKTTFLKTLCGIYDDYSGTIRIGPSLNMAYFSQELETLNYKATILEDVLTEGCTSQEARLLLASLLFRGDDVYKRIDNLSMGEKGRVAFAKLILSGANLLVLDEPTNYMDIESKEKVEEALEQFQGSIIFVSHDRYFIKRLARKVFVIEEERLDYYDGDYEYYLSKISQEGIEEAQDEGYKSLTESIMRLEVELAFLGGRLNETLDEEEKEELNTKYIDVARELNRSRDELTNF